MHLSTHFELAEFVRSDLATRLGIENAASPTVIDRLEVLCTLLLEPIRKALGPVQITSGYRCTKLNKALGSTSTSQHIKGEAADIVIAGHRPIAVCRWIKASGLPFHKCIYEGTWTHVSIAPAGTEPLRACYTAIFVKGEKTRYVAGFIED